MSATKDLIQARFDEVKAELAALQLTSQPIRDERDQYLAQIEALSSRVKELTGQIRAIEDPGVFDLSREISLIAGALGGYSLARGE